MSDDYTWPALTEREAAEMRGFDPCPDDNAPIPAHMRLDPDDPWQTALDAAYAEYERHHR